MLTTGSATHIGKRKQRNEDAHYISHNNRLLVLCDGMGGHADGDIASKLAVSCINSYFDLDNHTNYTATDVATSIGAAHQYLLSQAKRGIGTAGMGTTAVVALFQEDGVFEFAWVGDSRAYLITPNSIRALTQDHTFVQLLLNEGHITEAEASNHPYKSVLTQAVGGDKNTVEPQSGSSRLSDGDFLMLCSDGLTNELKDHDIHKTILAHSDLDAATTALVTKANNSGGKDNISVILIRYQESHGST